MNTKRTNYTENGLEYWKVTAANGETLGVSDQGFKHPRERDENFEKLGAAIAEHAELTFFSKLFGSGFPAFARALKAAVIDTLGPELLEPEDFGIALLRHLAPVLPFPEDARGPITMTFAMAEQKLRTMRDERLDVPNEEEE